MSIELITPDWPAPEPVKACVTTRKGGVSQAPYDSFNLAQHVGDDVAAVTQNRALLKQALNLPVEPVWLEQVHGTNVIDAAQRQVSYQADASYSQSANVVCAVMTADCLPLLICNQQGTQIAAAHAGWRGLQAGVIEHTIDALDADVKDLLVWLGPAIGAAAFEVGDEVKQAFEQDDAQAAQAFKPAKPGHWMADMYCLARQRLHALGVTAIYGGDLCSFTDEEQFYSYRRDGKTGRMASLIWIAGD